MFCLTPNKELIIPFVLLVVGTAIASDFRGGTISCDSIPSLTAKCYWKTGWALNAGSGPCCGACSPGSVGALSSCPVVSWSCASGCSSVFAVAGASPYTLTAWNTAESWEQGENSFSYTFGGSGPYTIEYAGCCWPALDGGVGSGAAWAVRTRLTLGARDDTGLGNSSPRTLAAPVYRLQHDCGEAAIRIPMHDNDGDLLQCRWAVGDECAGVCGAMPHTALVNSNNDCILKANTSGVGFNASGWYAVALTVEDFPVNKITIDTITYTNITVMSAVPLQFLVYVPAIASANCSDVPVFVSPTPAADQVFTAAVGTPFSIIVQALSSSQSLVSTITVSGPAGGTVSPAGGVNTGPGNERFVTWSWTPTSGKKAGSVVCFEAADGFGKTSEYRCITVAVAVTCPDPGAGSNTNRSPAPVQTFNYNDAVEYTCLPDPKFANKYGNQIRTCQMNGVFDGFDFGCFVCADPGFGLESVRNYVTEQGFDEGAVVTYICKTGYDHDSGDTTRTCQGTGTFDGSTHTCVGGPCSTDPGDGVNALRSVPSSHSFIYPESITYSCQPGYVYSSGDETRTCQATGTFSGTVYICEAGPCPDPGLGNNSARNFLNHNFTYLEKVTYSCLEGYEYLSGSTSRTCQATGQFNGSPLNCQRVSCPDPGAGTSANRTGLGLSFVYEDTVEYTCHTGHYHVSGDTNRTCQANKTFSGAALVCGPVPCLDPGDGVQANRSVGNQSFVYLDTVGYECILGHYHVAGNVSRTCQANGTFSGSTFTCDPAPCPDPGYGVNANRSAGNQSFVYNDTVEYQCDFGYYYVSGDGNRTCQGNSTFSGAQFTCDPVPCADPGSGVNATRDVGNVSLAYGDVVRYTCVLGHVRTGGLANRTCQANGWFDGSNFTCEPVSCPDPGYGVNANRSTGNQSFLYNDTLQYTCNLGHYSTAGDANRTCQANGTFSGSTFTCQLVPCPDPGYGVNANRSAGNQSFVYEGRVEYECNVGYYHVAGDGNRTCQAAGQFSGANFTCDPVPCADPGQGINATRNASVTSFVYQDTVRYTCPFGYYGSSGNALRVCQANRTFSGSALTCTPVSCGDPGPGVNTNRSHVNQSFVYSEPVTYACQPGYLYGSGDAVRNCTSSGTFDGVALSCIPAPNEEEVAIASVWMWFLVAMAAIVLLIFLLILLYYCCCRKSEKVEDISRSPILAAEDAEAEYVRPVPPKSASATRTQLARMFPPVYPLTAVDVSDKQPLTAEGDTSPSGSSSDGDRDEDPGADYTSPENETAFSMLPFHRSVTDVTKDTGEVILGNASPQVASGSDSKSVESQPSSVSPHTPDSIATPTSSIPDAGTSPESVDAVSQPMADNPGSFRQKPIDIDEMPSPEVENDYAPKKLKRAVTFAREDDPYTGAGGAGLERSVTTAGRVRGGGGNIDRPTDRFSDVHSRYMDSRRVPREPHGGIEANQKSRSKGSLWDHVQSRYLEPRKAPKKINW